jgi:hypothetical protein
VVHSCFDVIHRLEYGCCAEDRQEKAKQSWIASGVCPQVLSTQTHMWPGRLTPPAAAGLCTPKRALHPSRLYYNYIALSNILRTMQQACIVHRPNCLEAPGFISALHDMSDGSSDQPWQRAIGYHSRSDACTRPGLGARAPSLVQAQQISNVQGFCYIRPHRWQQCYWTCQWEGPDTRF